MSRDAAPTERTGTDRPPVRAVLTHIALHVRDIALSRKFYERYCGFHVIHGREEADGTAVQWLADPRTGASFAVVLIDGGPGQIRHDGDFSHLGLALHSRAAVDAIAALAAADGCLIWPPRQAPYPVGYFCGLRDPDGNAVEFSYGQPLGPGADTLPAAAGKPR